MREGTEVTTVIPSCPASVAKLSRCCQNNSIFVLFDSGGRETKESRSVGVGCSVWSSAAGQRESSESKKAAGVRGGLLRSVGPTALQKHLLLAATPPGNGRPFSL